MEYGGLFVTCEMVYAFNAKFVAVGYLGSLTKKLKNTIKRSKKADFMKKLASLLTCFFATIAQ
jgi:hypothetical protein